VNSKLVNRRVIKSLISAGALDCFGQTRPQMLAALEVIANCAKNQS
ncbi:MAG: hypothetical protein ACKESB_03725, partial [Candidatus Hodgkinia cicadicola]